MKLLFWLSIFLIFYTYLLYPSWLFLRARLYPRPVRRKPIFPKNIDHHCCAQRGEAPRRRNYIICSSWIIQKSLVETLIVSDGSTDQTNDLLSNHADSRVRSIILPAHGGKAEALNRADRSC